jgi:hypothetical protein
MWCEVELPDPGESDETPSSLRRLIADALTRSPALFRVAQLFKGQNAIAKHALAESVNALVRSGKHDFSAVHVDGFLVIRKTEL